MLPSTLIQGVADAIAEVEGVEAVLAYDPIASDEGVLVPTVWVDLESLVQQFTSTESDFDALATYKITVAVPHANESQILAWDLAYAVGARLHMQVLADVARPAQLNGITRSTLEFGNDLDSCEIDLRQSVSMPTMKPAEAGQWLTNPSAIWASRSPFVGIPNIPLYKKISAYP